MTLTAAVLALGAGTAPLPAQAPVAGRSDTALIRRAERQRSAQEALLNDWASLSRYRRANDSLPAPKRGENRVVYIGDSITESWAGLFPALFPGKPYIGRGISGQTTPQILVRFRQDVVALQPKVVVILAGTNDLAGNTGPSTLAMIQDNIASMAEIARANGIRVVLCSVLPAYDYPWKRGLHPAPKISALNSWIRRYSEETGAVYLDYHTAMVDSRGGLRAELTQDGVHPTAAGYAVMAPLAEEAIAKALRLHAPRQHAASSIDSTLRAELVRLGREDQTARDGFGAAAARNDTVYARQLMIGDSARTERLRAIVRTHGWPGRSLVGEDGARAAWLILQHSASADFQRTLLPALWAAAEQGEVAKATVAMLTDRVLVRDGNPQRYGTSFSMRDGRLVPDPIEDLVELEIRRAGVGLPSMIEYVRQLGEMYRVPVTWPPAPSK